MNGKLGFQMTMMVKNINKIKVISFGMVSLLSPIIGVVVLLGIDFNLNGSLFNLVEKFYFVGVVIILIDLWFSKIDQDSKIWWSVVCVIFNPVALPFYWVKKILPQWNISSENGDQRTNISETPDIHD
ncbi:MAG: hypothetical protein MJA84_06110 [Firmicutes bacterium]|nr:hypothetical protein [Bacillota bacterium]